MRTLFSAAAVIVSVALPAAVQAAMTDAEFRVGKTRINDEFAAAKRKCRTFGGNAGDICLAEARGNFQVAMAELEELRNPSTRSRYKLLIAKAEAEFDVAREECDESTNGTKDACLAEARAAFERDKANATESRRPR